MTTSRSDEIRANLGDVMRRVAEACARARRDREGVRLVAVTKTFPASDVDLAVAAGVTNVGENRVQEARDKQPLVRAAVRWHLIGHLQSNKVKDAVRIADVIQSVDSLALAERIARASEAIGKIQPVLLQVNIGREPQKGGVEPEETLELARSLSRLPSLQLWGLMAIPPALDAEQVRPFFRELRSLRDAAGLRELSMGMTDDFETAIEEGSTMIRVGRAIFGTR